MIRDAGGWLVVLLALGWAGPLAGQDFVPAPGTGAPATPAPAGWPPPLPLTAGPPPGPVIRTGLPECPPPLEPLPLPPMPGQQHWVALNLSVLQPTVGRLQVKVWPRPNNSLWLEVYGGSVLFDGMYGFGARMMHTARVGRRGDVMMFSPGLGLHILPNWEVAGDSNHHVPFGSDAPVSFGGWGPTPYTSYYNTLYFVAADIDWSWLHDFGDHFGFELGMKFGIAARVSGTVGSDFPRSVMFGKDVYPILNFYSGVRF